MAPNGAAVRLSLDDSPLISIPAAGADVDTTPAVTETELGNAVASATAAFCFAALESWNGSISQEVKTAIAERSARLALMQLSYEGSDADFTQAARDAAMPVLRRALDAEYFQRFSAAQADAALDVWLAETIAFVGHLVDTERAFVRMMAH